MGIRTGLIVTTAGVVSLIVSRPLAQGQSATGPSRHAPSTRPHHPAGGWGGPPMMMRDGHGDQGWPFGGRPMRDSGPGFGRGDERPRSGDGSHGGESAHVASTDDAKAIAELTKQVRALTEQVKELRQSIASETEQQERDGDRGRRGGRSLGRDGEERSFDQRDDHQRGRDDDDDRPSGRRSDDRERRDDDDDRGGHGPERFAPPQHGSDHMSWHHDD